MQGPLPEETVGWLGWSLVGIVGLVACSFQDFDYLQKGQPSSSGATGETQGNGGHTTSGGGEAGSSPVAAGMTGGGAGGSLGEAGADAGAEPEAGSGGGSGGEGGSSPAIAGMTGDGRGGSLGDAGAGAGAGPEAGSGGGSGGEGGSSPATAGMTGDGRGGSLGKAGASAGVGPGGVSGGGGESGDSAAGGGEAGASGTEPGTPIIVNPSFEAGYTGWIFDPPDAAGDVAYVQWPPSGSTTVDELNELSTWSGSSAFTLSVYQSLSGLDDGTYTFTGNFNFEYGHNAVYLFARDCGGDDRQADVPQTAPTEWVEFSLPGIEVVGGSCEVGFFLDANAGNWLNADLFNFERDPE